ncbi:MaoC family dehydratase [Vibrio kyushuensis]|uniref:MaoC family dehydratase n=1 Tax=Vibrio kyushuensis TaxID=2910249 RepID=UPI003D0AB824
MSYTIEQLEIGQSASVEKRITQSEVLTFADISGDINPVHIDEAHAKASVFGERIAHGALVSGLTSTVLGMRLPGEGTIYLGQENRFVAPVYFDDVVTARCEIIEINKEKNIVKFSTTTTNQDGKVVITGVATVMPPKDNTPLEKDTL